MSNTEPRLRNKKEAATFLQVSEATIDNFRKDGRLPFIKIGVQVRFLDSDLVAFIDRFRVEKRTA